MPVSGVVPGCTDLCSVRNETKFRCRRSHRPRAALSRSPAPARLVARGSTPGAVWGSGAKENLSRRSLKSSQVTQNDTTNFRMVLVQAWTRYICRVSLPGYSRTPWIP
ncbi:Protein of unknown function [Pyronema omphalodes CBS 100304]|uniref:Uncharacterized protein n=1 Tax=Pyronema omphalodes (strain CBS 100304) TaxID=1076935 RepID=U4LQU7_PYROM|nr:Protein of unknown function [Pyronema omphalodes CBS 100304]